MFSKRFILGVCSAAVVALTLTACPPPAPIDAAYVANGPPPLQSEVVVATPGPGYVWVPGYWNWGGADYVWVGGGWRQPPHDGAAWYAPRWHRTTRGWYMEHGGWR